MSEQLRLFSVRGIPVGINWSVLIIAWLIGAGLANTTLPSDYPNYRDAEYAIVSAIVVGLFFASLLGHELAHALVAERHGVDVEGITLWLIGGVAKFRDDPPSASSDLRIAAVGPAASLVIGGGWLLIAVAGSALGLSRLVFGSLLWLGGVNIVLAIFNLLPAFPLDGGRVLRAALWRRSGDHVQATESAARVGRVFVALLVAAGMIFMSTGFIVNAIWMWLLAWFLFGAGIGELEYARQRATFSGRSIGDIMTPKPVTIRATADLQQVIDTVILANRWSAYPVVDGDDRLVGLLTLDSLRHLHGSRRAGLTALDAALAIGKFAVAGPEEAATDALERMAHYVPNRLVVVDENHRPVGIVSITDVTRELRIAGLGHRVAG